MNNRRVIVMIMLFLLPTLACGLVDQVLEPQSTLAPPPTVENGLPPTSTLQPAGETAAAGAPATPTLAVSPSAAAPTLEELGTPPETLDALSKWISEARAVGASIGDVCAVLQDATWREIDDTCEASDFDGDGQQEWLLTLDTSRLQEDPDTLIQDGHPGDFWIVSRDGLVYQARDADEPESFATAPRLVELADLTGDERPEAVTVFTICGAHTCYNYYQIIGAHGGSIRNLVDNSEQVPDTPEPAASTISMAYVDQEEIRDANNDDLPDLVIHGGIVGSVGAGIQRARTEIWAWDGEAITLAEQEWQETNFRFHWLYNANYAFGQQEFDLARARYEEVIVNPNLEDTEGFSSSAQQVRDYTRQYAAFRLSLLPLLRGDITESTRWRNWLNEEYPQAPITAAADHLFAVWDSNGNDLAAACDEVTTFLESAENPTGPLVDMGYNNPSLTAETLCQLE